MPVYRNFLTALCFALASAACFSQNFWQPLDGPNGVQGIETIASDAAGNHFMIKGYEVYRSSDGGLSWSLCMSGISGSVSSYSGKFMPAASGAMYLYDGGAGAAIYRYVPATNSWKTLDTGFSWAEGAALDPQGRIWAVERIWQIKIAYSDDQGQTFQTVGLSQAVGEYLEHIAAFNDAHNLIVVSNTANDTLYHFTKSGTVHQVFTGEGIRYVAYDPFTGTAFLSTWNNKFYRSADGGLTWQEASLGSPGLYYVEEMFFEPSGRIWAMGENYTALYSDDNGQTWKKDNKLSAVHGEKFLMPDGSWYSINTCDTGLPFSRSFDGGATWQELGQQWQEPSVRDINMDRAGNLYALTCRREAYEISADGGKTWSDFAIFDGTTTYAQSLAIRADGVMMAGCSDDAFRRSVDGGATWSKMNSPILPVISDQYDKFYVDDQGVFYLEAVATNTVFKSFDGGNSWEELPLIASGLGQIAIHPNGDLFVPFWTNTVQHYFATTGLVEEIELSTNDFFDVDAIHCTRNGTLFVAVASGTWSGLLRLPDGADEFESIPFFNDEYVPFITSNSEGDIIAITDEEVYKSDDDGLSWQLLGSLPPSIYGIGTLFCGTDEHLYIGVYGAPIHRSAQPLAESKHILGKVWLDADGDCQFDSGETAFPSVVIEASGNAERVGFAGYNGTFSMSVPAGDYTLNAQAPNALFEPCFPDVPISLSGASDTAQADLPMKIVAQCPYLSVNLSTPFLRRCFENAYTIRYRNEGTAPALAASLEVVLDSFFVFQSASAPPAGQVGQKFTFELGDLQAGQTGTIVLRVKVSCDAEIGQEHCISAHISPDALCLPALLPLADAQECRTNIGSFDPNDKQAFVGGHAENSHVAPGADIEYLIRFQNTGTDTAFRVVVEDRLSGLLDLATLVPLASSHPFSLELRDARAVRFVFDNIALPDSHVNAAASHGFVKFRVAQAANVALGSVIRNEADIFFDFNAAVRTNESALLVGTTGSRPDPAARWAVFSAPNPFSETATFWVKGAAQRPSSLATLRLFDVLGREVRRADFSGDSFVMPRAGLERGLYFFRIESGGQVLGTGKTLAE